jgi:type II secretory ATPase GspE/PulE/Tfp pilus assembly ATPase PilB-like protein
MKSGDLRKAVTRIIDDGMTSVQISKQIRNVVSQRTVRRLQNSYKLYSFSRCILYANVAIHYAAPIS